MRNSSGNSANLVANIRAFNKLKEAMEELAIAAAAAHKISVDDFKAIAHAVSQPAQPSWKEQTTKAISVVQCVFQCSLETAIAAIDECPLSLVEIQHLVAAGQMKLNDGILQLCPKNQ